MYKLAKTSRISVVQSNSLTQNSRYFSNFLVAQVVNYYLKRVSDLLANGYFSVTNIEFTWSTKRSPQHTAKLIPFPSSVLLLDH